MDASEAIACLARMNAIIIKTMFYISLIYEYMYMTYFLSKTPTMLIVLTQSQPPMCDSCKTNNNFL